MDEQLPLAERPFSHSCGHGTTFECDRCDLSSVIRVYDAPFNRQEFAADVAEMIGYHAAAIHPDLRTGFSGYNTLKFKMSGQTPA